MDCGLALLSLAGGVVAGYVLRRVAQYVDERMNIASIRRDLDVMAAEAERKRQEWKTQYQPTLDEMIEEHNRAADAWKRVTESRVA
jgi:hypothetical protein